MIHQIYRYILMGVLMIAAVVVVHAETISQKQAKKIAEQFFNAAYGMKMTPPEYVYNGKALSTGRFMTPFYLYNHPSGGFVIISADNKAFPILAFDLEYKFDKNKIGPQMLGLLTLYTRHIEHIRYDSQIPYDAIEAWKNLPLYIHNVLNADGQVNEIIMEEDDVRMALDNVINGDESWEVSQSSVTYTPKQWASLIDEELTSSSSVAVGLIEADVVTHVVANGKKGNMYRLTLDGRNSGWYRLMPTEIINFGQIASLSKIEPTEEDVIPEPVFTFYESFVAETRAKQLAEQAAIENKLTPTEPVVRRLGGGHFMINIPENIALVRVYSLGGQTMWHSTYSNTSIAAINLASSPVGFYFAVLWGESGKHYGVKIFR